MSNQRGNVKRQAKWATMRATAMEMRIRGEPYSAIGKVLEVTRQQAHNIVKRELERIRIKTGEDAVVVRTMELQRLDVLTVTLWPMVLEGDLKAMDRMLRVMERRAKLCALDEADFVVGQGTEASMSEAVARAYRGLGIAMPQPEGEPDLTAGGRIQMGTGPNGNGNGNGHG